MLTLVPKQDTILKTQVRRKRKREEKSEGSTFLIFNPVAYYSLDNNNG
jgi:hypothetical protein